MLKIATDGRKAALDMRLVAGPPSSTTSKLDVAADTIASIWRKHRDRSYIDSATGERSPLARSAADRLLRPLHTIGALERLRGTARARDRARHPARARPVHSRSAQTIARRPGCSPPAAPAGSP